MRLIHLHTETSRNAFQVPCSDGYSVYSALLSVIQAYNPDIAEQLHDTSTPLLHISGLTGDFDTGNTTHTKTATHNTTYALTIGLPYHNTDLNAELYQILFEAFAVDNTDLELTHGSLTPTGFDSETTKPIDLTPESPSDISTIRLSFNTPTCIHETEDVTTIFPHRRPVFNSLRRKWETLTHPSTPSVTLCEDDIQMHIVESRTYEYQSHNTVTKQTSDNGNTVQIRKHGFTGTVDYQFKESSEELKRDAVRLARFGEFSGVGRAVSRGCGNITATVNPAEGVA